MHLRSWLLHVLIQFHPSKYFNFCCNFFLNPSVIQRYRIHTDFNLSSELFVIFLSCTVVRKHILYHFNSGTLLYLTLWPCLWSIFINVLFEKSMYSWTSRAMFYFLFRIFYLLLIFHPLSLPVGKMCVRRWEDIFPTVLADLYHFL